MHVHAIIYLCILFVPVNQINQSINRILVYTKELLDSQGNGYCIVLSHYMLDMVLPIQAFRLFGGSRWYCLLVY